MSVRRQLVTAAVAVIRKFYVAIPFPGVARPVFIIGCGRSGTTILGMALSRHRQVTYLNEPRGLWTEAYPETDVWSTGANAHGGKLHLTADDVDPEKSRKLSRLFRFETIRQRRSVLVEKLPINNFRLDFLHEIFPDARFIHIYRNGLEVARSIEKLSNEGRWFGAGNYKWDRLVDYATRSGEAAGLPSLCTTDFDKGLLEWRLSTEAAVTFLRSLPDDAFFEVSYDLFVDDPNGTILQILAFIGIDEDREVSEFVAGVVARRSSKLSADEVSAKMRILGGELLPRSMDHGRGLVRRSS